VNGGFTLLRQHLLPETIQDQEKAKGGPNGGAT